MLRHCAKGRARAGRRWQYSCAPRKPDNAGRWGQQDSVRENDSGRRYSGRRKPPLYATQHRGNGGLNRYVTSQPPGHDQSLQASCSDHRRRPRSSVHRRHSTVIDIRHETRRLSIRLDVSRDTDGLVGICESQPVSELSVGDIVSVTTNGGDRLTHRVYGIDQLDNNLSSLTLKGDANNAPDSETYVVADADLVVFSMSRVGYVLAWLSGPIGIFAGGLFAGSLLMIAFRPAPRGEGPPNGGMPGEDTPNDTPTALEHNSPRSGSTQVSPRILTAPWRQRELILVTAAGLGALLVMSPIGNTAAEITDTATAKTGQFATVQTFTCEDYSPGLFASSARITWTAPGTGNLHLSCSGTQARRNHVQRQHPEFH